MPRRTLYTWKQAPFLRLIIIFIVGIILQWYCKLPAQLGRIMFITALLLIVLFNAGLHFRQFYWGWMNGLFIHAVLLSLGLLIAYQKDISHSPNWMNNYYQEGGFVIASIEEPLSEKANSFKANASVQQVIENGIVHYVKGNIILYFQKDSSLKTLQYGTQILFNKSIQAIRNSGNPGTFDYQRYAAFSGIYQQVFLKPGEFAVLAGNKGNLIKKWLFNTRERVVRIIAAHIPEKKEAGLAEALLIGYKGDLDKTLVQSYSNTGVVHIIAISGLHLGLIYWLLNLILRPLKKYKTIRWLRPIFMITGLWSFALLAGGGPSILRSAVMFSFIVIGESMERKTSIYNSLAASAFMLLCINPFWLWDAGFQLSYIAVLSIVVFLKPIYHLFYFKNRIVDTIWKLNAVTLAAQILTIPVTVYQFHQFPNYFLITNVLAVPLSSLIVLGEILLCVVAIVPAIATKLGLALQSFIQVMNGFVEHMESLPFSLWDGLYISVVQLILMYACIICISYWLLQKNKSAVLLSLLCLFAFLSIRAYSFIEAGHQQKMIVYHVPRHQAIDFVNGRNYYFTGDAALKANDFLQIFYLKPSRILYRIHHTDALPALFESQNCFLFNQKKIVLINKDYDYSNAVHRIKTDAIIISKNPVVDFDGLFSAFDCRQIIFDGSNPQWKVNKWKADCAKLGLACYSVVDKGAFVMKMD
jgi:competence protein ComEC